jgi:phage gp29-like protein
MKSKLVDQYGNPVELDQLEEELAIPTLAGIRSVWNESIANHLTPTRLAGILRSVDEGNALEYLTLAEEMEERDLHYFSVLGTRKLAVGGLNLNVEAASDDPEDVKIADFVREVLTTEEASNLVADQMDALGKGYAVSEIMWDHEGSEWFPKEYKPRDQRFFVFDRIEGQELRLKDEKDPVWGIPLAPYKFVQHRPHLKTGLPIRGGLARLCVVAYMCKSYSLKDWLAFAEVFGMPLRIGKYHAQSTKEDRAKLLKAVCQIGTDAAAIIPESMIIEFQSAPSTRGGERLFEGLANFLDKQVSKGVLGQTATTEGTPGKLGADTSQENVREDIRTSDAKQLSATLRKCVVRPVVDLNFGARLRGKYPIVKLETETVEDLQKLSIALPPFIDRGLRVEESVIRDKFGLPEPEEGAAILGAKPPPQPFGGQAPQPGQPGQQPQGQLPNAADNMTPAEEMQAEGEPPPKAMMSSHPAPDEIDKLAEQAVASWQETMSPLLTPVIELANTAKDKIEFLKGLKRLKVDKGSLTRSLAVAMFKARGLSSVGPTALDAAIATQQQEAPVAKPVELEMVFHRDSNGRVTGGALKAKEL